MRAPPLVVLAFVLLTSSVGVGQDRDAEELADLLRSGDLSRRQSVLAGLAEIAASGSESDRALSLIVAALDYPDVEVREQALTTIRKLGPRAAIATVALIELLEARSEEEQRRAAGAIAAIGTGANAAGEQLLRVAEDRSREQSTIQAALLALGKLERGPELDRGLLRIYADRLSGVLVRPLAIRAYGSGEGAAPANVVPVLVQALSDRSRLVREAAAMALAQHGPAAGPAAPALAEVLSGETNYGRAAAWAMEKIGEPALPALVELVFHPSEGKRKLAAEILEQIGKGLEQKGKVCWWVIPRVFLNDLITLAVLLLVWIAAARRFPKRTPTSRLLRALQIAIVVGVPVVVTGLAVYHATTLSWSSYYLPKPPVALVSPATAATLSCMFLVALPGVWSCIRRSEPPAEGSIEG
ncbi:MAG: HEAT repeat domain-containing protein [Planctomycetes bacterium]|nr:HEAT repeat domain-containing protein [Planctomycetota bacterium]